jgi:predicted dienelactone hydrolase
MKAMEKLPGWGAAIPNAMPDTSGAPYPLVIFSPGYSSSAANYITLEEHLASYGFIVLGTALSGDPAIWKHFQTRPMVTHREIDFAENLSSRDGSLKGLIDTKHIGVAGHSSGGYTALAAAGAQLNFAWFENWCADHKDSPDATWACPELLTHKQDMLALAGLDSMPKALWPSWGDARVTAVIMQTGGAFMFGPSGLASVTIPVMVQVGSLDTIATPEWNAYLTYDSVSSTQKALVVFDGAGHTVFVGSSGPTQDIIRHFTTAFLLDTLKSDKDAHKVLLPDAVKFPGIQYKTTMK